MELAPYIDPNFQVPLPVQKNETESWGSIFWNAAKENYPGDPKILFRLARQRLKELGLKEAVLFPKSKEAIEIMAYLVGIYPTELFAATPSRFVTTVLTHHQQTNNLIFSDNSSRISFHAYRSRELRSFNKVHICLDCISDRPHHKTVFYLDLSIMCTTHGTLLTDKCPNCDSHITLYGAVMDKCQKCCAKFSLQPREFVDRNAPGSLAQNMIYNIAIGHDLGLMNNILKSPQAAYAFIRVLLRWLNNHDLVDFYSPELSYRNSISSNKLYNLLGIIYLILSNWPNNFLQFLDIHRTFAKDGRQFAFSISKIFDELLGIIRHFGIALEAVEPIKKVFINYCSARFSRIISFRETRFFRENTASIERKYMTPSQVMEYLGVRQTHLDVLTSKGELTTVKSYDQPSMTLYSWDEVDLLRLSFEKALTFENVTDTLGLSKSVARDLIAIGLLTAISNPFDGKRWLFDQEGILNLLTSIQKNYSQITDNMKTTIKLIPFLKTIKRLETSGLNQAKFIQVLVNDQNIRLFGPAHKFTGFYDVFLSDDELDTFIWNYQLRGKLVTREMIAKSMGVKLSVVTKWIRSGLLQVEQKHASRLYFSQQKIDTFIEEHIFVEDASKVFEMSQEVIWKWISTGRLHPVSGPTIDGCQRYLLKREELYFWTEKQLITAPKLAELLKMSHSQLLQWVKAGKITPVSGPGVDGYKQYFFEIDAKIQALIEDRKAL